MGRIYETAIRIAASITKSFGPETSKAAKAMTALNAATAAAKKKYDAASEGLRRLEAAEKSAGGATKESTKWRKAGERAVASAAREMDRATKAAERNAAALRKLDSAKMRAVKERLFGKPGTPTPLVPKLGQQLGSIAREALYLSTASLTAGAAVGALVLKTLKAGDEIGDTADKLGIGAEKLQELRYGAAQSGAEVGALDSALDKLAKNVGKFASAKGKSKGGGGFAIAGMQLLNTGGEGAGGGAEVDPFKKLGLNAKALAALAPEEKLKKIADAMQKLKTHDERAAVGAAIFGKGIKEILPFLEEGSAGIDRLSKDAHKYGGVLSAEAIKNADLADKAMRDAEMAFGGVTNTLGAELLPTVTRVFREFSGWVASNRTQIKAWAENAAKWIETKGIPAFKHIAGEVKSFAEKMLYLVEGAAKLTGGFDNLALVLVGLRLAPVAVTLGQIAANGFQAAAAIAKYAAAQAAANAAGGASGGAAAAGGGIVSTLIKTGAKGGAIGLAGLAGLAVGGLYGYALDKGSSYIEDKTGRNLNPFTRVSGNDLKAKTAEINDLKTKRDAVRAARAKAAAGGAAAGAVFSPTFHIGEGLTREAVAAGLDQAKKLGLDAYDKRAKNQRRVSFGE
jgi:hypothetical protein